MLFPFCYAKSSATFYVQNLIDQIKKYLHFYLEKALAGMYIYYMN